MTDPRFSPAHELDGYVRDFKSVDSVVAALQPSAPVYCLRKAELHRAAAEFQAGFPGDVLYAVKCNPHPTVLATLLEAGIAQFDTASLFETAAVHAAGGRACYMHPVKSRDSLAEAYRFYGVRLFAVDHADELAKMSEVLGPVEDLRVLIRFATPEPAVRYPLSVKFGASPADAVALLRAVSDRGWKTGLAFHVGSQCLRPDAYGDAIETAAAIAREAHVPLDCIDVGGGFPAAYAGETVPPLDRYFAAIRSGRQSAGLAPDCRLLCEPGRALVASACSVLVQVQLRKGDMLYLNDGIYHSLSEAVTGGLQFPVQILRAAPRPPLAEREFTLFGPTCDSTDVLPGQYRLPDDIREGDWIEFGQLGAYSNAVSTRFNGVFPDDFVTVESPPLLP